MFGIRVKGLEFKVLGPYRSRSPMTVAVLFE